jgi:hypothetical protein
MQSKPSVLLRQQLLIDHHVQGSLLRRTAFYSCACAVYFIVILIFTESMSDPDEPLMRAVWRCLDEAIYWAPGLMLLTPVMAYDLLKVTNRFAGPIFRLRREMQRLVDGESELPLAFRNGDYWTEMADIFNEIRDELHELRREKAEWVRNPNGADEIVSQKQLFTQNEDTGEPESSNDLLVSSGN